MMLTDGGPRPSDDELLEMIKERVTELIESLKVVEQHCGSPHKEQVRRKINVYKRLLYGAIYGHQPPVDLPDNWESTS